MATKYTYSIQNAFPNHKVAPDSLTKEIQLSAIATSLSTINAGLTDPDNCDIWFISDLAEGDVTILNNIVAAHIGIPLFPPLETVNFFDHFVGKTLLSSWATEVSGGGNVAIIDAQGGQVRIRAGGTAGYWAELHLRDSNWITPSHNPVIRTRAKTSSTSDMTTTIGLWEDGGVGELWFGRTGTENWKTKTTNANGSTVTDTGVVADTKWHLFNLVITTTKVDFYIDGLLKATHTTNIPQAMMNTTWWSRNDSGGTKDLFLDYINFAMDLET
jgi:hypothetical protein